MSNDALAWPSDPAPKPLDDTDCVREIAPGLFVEIVERKSYKKHTNFRASLPYSKGIEEGFTSGPLSVVYSDNGCVDIRTGLTLRSGRAIPETAITAKHAKAFLECSAEDMARAKESDSSHIVLPLASHRMRNYYHWWLDSVSKLFVCSKSSVFRSKLRNSSWNAVVPSLPHRFQRQTIKLLSRNALISESRADKLIRGRSVNSAGLNPHGAQQICRMVRQFSEFLELAMPVTALVPQAAAGELLYVSRAGAKMRRALNEEDLVSRLRDMGFSSINPDKVPLIDQITAFRNARVVVSVHGAGLTNTIFCRPGTTVVELFPEGGVHGSSFMRIASHLDFPYYYAVSEKVDNPKSAINPYNADLIVHLETFLPFLREIVTEAAGSDR